MNPINNKLIWAYQKNKHLIDSLLFRKAPEFVYGLRPGDTHAEIPVFTFHTALPDWFEEQCLHLVENGYRTLSADEFYSRMTKRYADRQKSVLITFDDGLKQVWSVAYPVLKKYGLNATCFLIPGCISESDASVRLNLDQVWSGDADVGNVMGISRGENPLATWEEIKIMHESGVIDFESHTMNHAVVPVSDEIVDFIHPGYDPHFYGNIHIPLYTENGVDVISRKPQLGMPVYKAQPRMQAESRYFDDEAIRRCCVEFVDKNGGSEYFRNKEWRAELHNTVDIYKRTHDLDARYETPEERDMSLFDELLRSREAIEAKLGGKKVTQLCYPWYDASKYAIEASRKAGYRMNYFGQREGRVTNQPGQDPFEIVRVEEIFLQRLPGKNRKTLWQTLGQMYKLRKLPSQLFPEGRPLIGQV